MLRFISSTDSPCGDIIDDPTTVKRINLCPGNWASPNHGPKAEQRRRSVDFWCEDDEIPWSDDEDCPSGWHDSQSFSAHSKAVAKVDRPTDNSVQEWSYFYVIIILLTIPQVSVNGEFDFYGYLISIFHWVRALPRVIDHIGLGRLLRNLKITWWQHYTEHSGNRISLFL